MTFTRSPYRLTRIVSVRVEDDFSDRLAEASLKAGVPNGVLLGRLVGQYLDDGKPMTAGEHYEALGRILGYLPEAGTPAAVKRRRKKSTPESTAVMATEADEADIQDRYGKSTDELADEAESGSFWS